MWSAEHMPITNLDGLLLSMKSQYTSSTQSCIACLVAAIYA